MAPVDPRIAAPRRPSPRLKVPRGSVAVAAGQTGIYPAETPGGWNLIGRTPVRPYAPDRSEPFLFSRATWFASGGLAKRSTVPRPNGMISDGLLGRRARRHADDGAGPGRWGYQGLGVPVAGPMDWYSHRIGEPAARERPNAAALEITLDRARARSPKERSCARSRARTSTRRSMAVRCRRAGRSRALERIAHSHWRATSGGTRDLGGARRARFAVDARQPRDASRQPHGSVRRARAAARGRLPVGIGLQSIP